MKLLSYLFREKAPEENRIAFIEVTAEALLGLFQLDGKRILRMEGVPSDARVEGMWVDDVTRTLRIAIRSEELALVTEGTTIPSIYVTVYTNEWVPQIPA